MRNGDHVEEPQPRGWQRRGVQALAVVALSAGLLFVLAAEYTLHNAEPILRKRIVETLSARFHVPVELDRVEISLFRGIEVNGYGLRIPMAQPSPHPYVLLGVQHFAFRTSLGGLLHQPTHVPAVRVDGMDLHIPPAGMRKGLFTPSPEDSVVELQGQQPKERIAIVVDELTCRGVRLFLESGKPGKVPLEFDIAHLDLQGVGRAQAMHYDAILTNAKPVGEIHATGHFGPWGNNSANGAAGDTPLDGDYTFDHADLDTIKGIGGMLSSAGHFAGVLQRLTVDGQADVPDFSLDISKRPMPLHTRFHALVDGTSGDTYLQPVQARLGSSDFTTSGKIVKVTGAGHDIALAVDIPHGRMQDFLKLAVKTEPPLMNGVLALKANLHIPPGEGRVPLKLAMAGQAHLSEVHFNSAKLQDRIDGLSARAQGRPREVEQVAHDHETEVHSELTATFHLDHGVAEVTDIQYAIPGALVLLNGVYSMDGRLFEFKGKVQTEATASEMVAGWKGMLLKPFDPLLKKNGAGVELPIAISGTQGDMHLGLALHGTDQTPRQMLTEVRQKAHAQQEVHTARQEAEAANQDDLEAAKATTLQAAEAAHNRAVKRRAQARARLDTLHGSAKAAPDR